MKKLLASLAVASQLQAGVNEREAVAATLIGEAGGESIEVMEAVHSVIVNRARLSKKTKLQIVTQKDQFTCVSRFGNGIVGLIRFAKQHPKWKTALRLARKEPTPTYWTHFTSIEIFPRWAGDGRGLKCQTIGALRFYALDFPAKSSK